MGISAATAKTDRSNGYARYVGRVGGLAFALGVGAAILAGGGVAAAETSDSAGGSAQSTSADTSPSAQATSAQDAESGTQAPSDSGSESDAASVDTAPEDEATGPIIDDEAGDVAETELAPDETDEAVLGTGEAAETELTTGEADETVFTAADVSDAAARTADQDTATGAEATAAATAEASLFERLFDNETPTLAHDPAENTVIEGRVEGDLHPEDSDSTLLTYTATAPDHGTVTIGPDGTFAYTPDESFAGQDSFVVTVSDARSGFHIHGFAGLLNLISFGLLGASGHRSTETVFIGFERAVVASGLNTPVDFRFLPDERIVVAEKGGAIKIVENGTVLNQPLITLPVSTLGERGISGLAVDPDFAENGYLYVAYTNADIRNQLSRLTVVGNAAGSELVLLESDQQSAVNHHGGALGFGPDGKLYWGVGDNAFGANSQDLTNIHGKILRLNPDGTAPLDNPDLGAGALPHIYAYGLRNPFRLNFTPDGGLLVADVGAASFEEVNLVTAGGNYGWPAAEGVCVSCTSLNPIYTYPRGSGAAITSVLFYDGDQLGPAYQNKVFIADLIQGWIKVLTCNPEFTSCGDPQDFDPDAGTTLVLAQGPDGNLYQLTYQPGVLVRIAPAG
ncbi:MAG: PQQ-dependent sugar dehydrogenase [Mycolicibacterium sp.]|uniref:PQQ-dependent sugar dehydrogenase n=1 Tax=Mycolicibacterium sp. TaxID=2320850 RepID=UPI003D0ABB5C